MNGLNVVILSGNITDDLEVEHTDSGKAKLNFSLAINQYYSGEQHTTFVPITAWEGTAEAVADNLSKGSPIELVGSINIYSYKDDQGNSKTFTSVVARNVNFLPSNGGSSNQKSKEEPKPDDKNNDDLDTGEDEEVPF